MSGGSKLAAGKLGGSISHFLSNKIQIQGVKMNKIQIQGVQMNPLNPHLMGALRTVSAPHKKVQAIWHICPIIL